MVKIRRSKRKIKTAKKSPYFVKDIGAKYSKRLKNRYGRRRETILFQLKTLSYI